jgi:putative tricarboxylic transport membrane protein
MRLKSLAAHALALACLTSTTGAAPREPACIAGARPGGGFEATCRLLQSGLAAMDNGLLPLRVDFMPGGIGSVAYNTIADQRPDEGHTFVTFSSGSLLNIALGRFGRFPPERMKWLAAIGIDYGVITVSADSPYQKLPDLLNAIRKGARDFRCGGAGNPGSQDWMKCALLARRAGLDPSALHYVAFEGGGEQLTALVSGYVQVAPSEAAEALALMRRGKVRILAVLAARRLEGDLAGVPTAREQGYDIEWSVLRGVYMGPKVADADYDGWKASFDRMLASPEFARLRRVSGMQPMALTGAALHQRVMDDIRHYRHLAGEFGLPVPGP